MTNETTQFKVESDIPVPTATARSGKAAAIRSLLPGQSIFFSTVAAGYLSSQISQIRRAMNDGRKYTVRKAEGGSRVWRLS